MSPLTPTPLRFSVCLLPNACDPSKLLILRPSTTGPGIIAPTKAESSSLARNTVLVRSVWLSVGRMPKEEGKCSRKRENRGEWDIPIRSQVDAAHHRGPTNHSYQILTILYIPAKLAACIHQGVYIGTVRAKRIEPGSKTSKIASLRLGGETSTKN